MKEIAIVVVLILAAKSIGFAVRSAEQYESKRWAEQCERINSEQAASLAGT